MTILLLLVVVATSIFCPCHPSCTSRFAVAAFAAPKQQKKKRSTNKTAGGGGGGGSGSGFGSGSTTSPTTKKTAKQEGLGLLKPVARDLLKKHNNNVDFASDEYFKQQMNQQLQLQIQEQKDGGDMDNDGDIDISNDDDDWGDTVLSDIHAQQRRRHQKHIEKVKATWDTVALFLPVDYERNRNTNNKFSNNKKKRNNEELKSYVDRRMNCIIHCCCTSGSVEGSAATTSSSINSVAITGHDDDDDDESFSLLDVGCGDGAILGYLYPPPSTTSGTTTRTKTKINKYKNNNSQTEKQKVQLQSDNNNNNQSMRYVGVDVSTEMIDLGRRRFPLYADRLIVGEFPYCLLDDDDDDIDDDSTNKSNKKFDTVLFNGSFQFFEDPRNVLRETVRRYLKLQRGSRIILCHVEGSKFVRHEIQTSQGVAVRTMPNRATLEEYASMLSPSLGSAGTNTNNHNHNNNDGDSNDNLKFKVMSKDEMLDGFELYDIKKDGSDDVFYLVALEIV